MLNLLILAALTNCDAPPAQSTAMGNPISTRVAAYVDSVERTGLSGTVLVATGDTVRVVRGFGYANRERCIPNTSETLFDIGSIAKTFNAIGAAQLMEARKLNRSDPITRYVSEVPSDKSGITIHQLLTHSAGLQSFHDTAGDFEVMTREDALARILRDSLRFAPGTKEAYSNSGYTLLAMIGQPWVNYMRTSIFRRAGIDGWLWNQPGIPTERVAMGYVGASKTGDPAHWPLTWASMGGAGMIMSAPDLFKFSRAINDGVLITHSTDSVMQIPATKKWAEGWEVTTTPYGKLVMKGGASEFGFTCQLRRYVDRDVTIILLLNSRRNDKDYPHLEVGDGLAKTVFEAGVAARAPRT